MGKDREENHDIPGSGDMAEFPTRSFADLPPKDGYPTRSLPDSPEEIGTEIGRYKLLSVLGEGGFGIVYLAEQKEPIRRQVALKIIKPGMDSKQVIARFEAERQALALLDHPNIARVFDAGTTENGRLYFVMEYVKGVPITEHCDRQRLTIEQRLELFLQVCEAIQHAHQKGIIHRDIKPSNILVVLHNDKAVPKVIDFGVAKAIGQPLTERTLFTEQGQLVGTPEYMSPEQAAMTTQDIDTRSDIYSLGVLLYELLTGTLPFEPETLRAAAFDEILRVIREEDPPRPSTRLLALGKEATPLATSRRTDVKTLAKRLGKELEWIPLKAMRKERDRRYKTASEFADDIRNYLNGNPLIAGPESVAYRARKFARKHTGLLVSAVAILVLLVLAVTGSVVSTIMYLRAEQAKNAEQEQRKLADLRAEDYRRSLYLNRINLAEKYYRENNISRVRELLDACPNDLRGWEWYYLWNISDQPRMTLRGHTNWVSSVTFSPDGKRIVSGSWDSTLKVWDAESGSEMMTLRGHEGMVLSVAFSPDGRRIVSGSKDNTLKVWDAESGREVMTLRGHEDGVHWVAFSPDGKRIVSGSGDNTLKVWDAESGGELMTLRGHIGGVSLVAFSPDGRRIVSGSYDNTLKVWDAESGREVMTLMGHNEPVSSVAFSPDDKRIVSGSEDSTLKVWDAESGGELMTLRGHIGGVYSVAFSADGRRIVSGGGDNTLKVWSAASPEEVAAEKKRIEEARARIANARAAEHAAAKQREIKPIEPIIPEENLEIPEGIHDCAGKLREIHAGIKQYEKDKGALPNRLSNLVPDYVGAETLLCPNDPEHKAAYHPDPDLPCSYIYEFSDDKVQADLTCRDWKMQQVKLFGNVVPIVRCMHHGTEIMVNLSIGGQVYWSGLVWERIFMPDYQFGDERLVTIPGDDKSENQQDSKPH